MNGEGLLNNVINKLPFELHLPGYQFCGPGTHLEKRLSKGQRGINKLDNACMRHDIAYISHNKEDRKKADIELIRMAKQRMKSKDASTGEKVSSWLVNKAMKTKVRLGSGLKNFKSVIKHLKNHLKKFKPKTKRDAIKLMYQAAKKLIPKHCNMKVPRVIPLPKTGGILPLIPVFAGLSALGALAGGAAGIAKAVNDYQTSKKNLKETQRHNRMMESITIGKGFSIKAYKSGNGIYIHPSKNF